MRRAESALIVSGVQKKARQGEILMDGNGTAA